MHTVCPANRETNTGAANAGTFVAIGQASVSTGTLVPDPTTFEVCWGSNPLVDLTWWEWKATKFFGGEEGRIGLQCFDAVGSGGRKGIRPVKN